MPLATAAPPPVKTLAAENGVTWPSAGTRAPYGQAGQDIYSANTRVFQASGAQNAAQAQLVAAQRAALNAGRQTSAASQAYLAERNRGLVARTNEEKMLQTAAGDTSNLTNVAAINQGIKAGDWRFSAAGAQAPVDVVLPEGQQPNNIGVRAATVTNADRIATSNANAQKLRSLSTEGAQLAVEQSKQNEDPYAFAVKDASLNVADATNAENNARLSAEIAKVPPASDLIYDENTGDFVTRDQKRLSDVGQNYEFHPDLQKYGLPAYMTQRQINERTDPDGNLRLDDGRKLDPKTGNLWIPRQGNVGGQWTDPKTGNLFEPYADPGGNVHDSWLDPKTGNRYVIMNPAKGTGYWLDPHGNFLAQDGIWRNPVTGLAIYSPTGETYGKGTTTGSTITIPYGDSAPSGAGGPAQGSPSTQADLSRIPG